VFKKKIPMKYFLARWILLFSVILPSTSALAQPTTSPTKKAAIKKPVAKKKSLKTASNTPKSSAASTAAAATGAAALATVAVALTPEQHDAATHVHTGRMVCDLDAYVQIEADAQAPGRFHVQGRDWQKKPFQYHMTPVLTSSGAVRLEDARAQTVWIQIPAKSMLMNQQLGQRMADGCMGAEQLTVAAAHKEQPPPDLLAEPTQTPHLENSTATVAGEK